MATTQKFCTKICFHNIFCKLNTYNSFSKRNNICIVMLFDKSCCRWL